MSFQAAVEIYLEVTKVIAHWCESNFDDNLLFVSQFGSSLSALPKHVSDFDIFFAFQKLPKNRREMWALIEPLEDVLIPQFRKLADYGFQYHFSPVLRDTAGLERFSYFYLNLPEQGRFLHSSPEQWKKFIERVVKFRQHTLACKRTSGSQVVWDLSATPESELKF